MDIYVEVNFMIFFRHPYEYVFKVVDKNENRTVTLRRPLGLDSLHFVLKKSNKNFFQ